MSLPLIDTISASLFGSSGSMYLVGLLIMLFFFIAFLIIGLPFKYSLMFVSPLPIAFVQIGWFPQIIATIFWLLIAGFGIFMFWTYISDR